MTDGAVQARVTEIVALVLDVDLESAGSLRRDVSPTWDSLRHIEIVLAVEDEFGVSVAEEDFAALSSVDAISSHVTKLRAAG